MDKFRRDIPGWLHSNEVDAMTKICKMVPKKSCAIEVGVFAGRTTQVIASVIKRERIYCVDPWPTHDKPFEWGGMTDYTGPEFDVNSVELIFKDEIVSKFSNIRPVKGFFPDAMHPKIIEKLTVGLIHWDVDCVNNIELMKSQFRHSWSILRQGGILSGHTFAAWMPAVVQAVRDFSMEVKCDVVLPPSGSIWYMIKP